MKIKEFLNQIEKSYKKEFPNSKIQAALYKGLGKSIYIKCLLAGSRDELINGYEENDMFNINFWFQGLDNDAELETELTENICLEPKAKSYLIKPENKYLCYSSRKLNYRKVKGIDKNLKTIDKFFKKLKEQLEEDIAADQITENHKGLLISKI